MQSIRYLEHWLSENANQKHFLFTLTDLRGLLPLLSDTAFKALLSRAALSGILTRVCRGIYLYKKALPADGLFLFHVAALARSNEFNYISLETVLSDSGIISQIPINSISIMSSGRSSTISCGDFGVIEFVHTAQKPTALKEQLTYDSRCGLWRASVALALRDMKHTRRNCDLIDWDIADEFI